MAYVFYQQMTDIFLSKLNSLGSTSVNCSIYIGSITGFFGNNCNIEIKNSCLANQTVINALLLSSLYTTLNTIQDETLKSSVMNYLGITNVEDISNSTFQSQCDALALINNNISILQLNFNKCESTVPITLKFINTGNAMASCGLTSILNAFISSNANNIYNINNTKENTFYLNYVILGIFALTCIILILYFLKNKKKYVYKIDHKERDNTILNKIIKFVNNLIKDV